MDFLVYSKYKRILSIFNCIHSLKMNLILSELRPGMKSVQVVLRYVVLLHFVG